jgi:hypothetical protein
MPWLGNIASGNRIEVACGIIAGIVREKFLQTAKCGAFAEFKTDFKAARV